MCVACIEYIKDRLNIDEYKSALREMTVEDQEHAREVEKLFKDFGAQPDELKKRLRALTQKP
jgi:hypothetical protein